MAEALLLVGCRVNNQPVPSKSEPTPKILPSEVTETLEQQIQKEIRRLALQASEDSITRKIYLGNLTSISSVFNPSLRIGAINPEVAFARQGFDNPRYSPNKRFRYTLHRDGSVADYETLERLDCSIYFSPLWLRFKSDTVKTAAMQKEASSLFLFESFTQIALNTYSQQGKIDKIDPNVKEDEIARTLGLILNSQDANVRKLFDYAGYLAILPEVGKIVESVDTEAQRELAYTNAPAIYTMAKDRGITAQTLEFGSAEFLNMAFSQSSPWVQMIQSPNIPEPKV